MKLICGVFALLTAVATSVMAGTGAMLPGGKQLIRSGEKALHVYSLEEKTETELSWPEELEFSYPSIAATDESLFAGNGDRIFRYDLATEQWEEFWTLGKGWKVNDLTYDAKTKRLVAVTGNEDGKGVWWVFPDGQKEPRKVFNRRAGGAENPVFDGEGNLYFTVSGDVWKGELEDDEEDDEPRCILIGERIWPLAIRETEEGNSSGSSAKSLLPIGKWIVLELSRSGGSGWGNIIRVPNVNAYEAQLALKWDELGRCEMGSDAAISADGKSAFIYNHSEAKWSEVLAETGELRPLPVVE